MKKEFPGVTHYRDRHGKLRWRYRSKGFTVNLGTEYGGPDFLRRYSAAVKGERLPSGQAAERPSQAPHGSLSRLIDLWYKSPMFKRLGEGTARNYRRIAEDLRDDCGDRAVGDMDRSIVKKIMAKKSDTPAAANHRLRILRFLLDEAVDHNMLEHNPARDVQNYALNTKGFHTWSEDEIKKFQDKWPEGTLADLAMSLMLYTGAARSDAVQLGPDNVDAGRISYVRQKMKNREGVLVDIPIHPNLWRRIEPLMDQATFLQTQEGKQRSPNGLGNQMRKWCDDAGLSDCTAHGLRKAIARRLAEAGSTPHEIQSVTGHKTLGEVERYTAAVGRAALADSAMKKAE